MWTTSGGETMLWSKETHQHSPPASSPSPQWTLPFVSCSSHLRTKGNTSVWPCHPLVIISWSKHLKLIGHLPSAFSYSLPQRTVHLKSSLRKSSPMAGGSPDQIQPPCFHSFGASDYMHQNPLYILVHPSTPMFCSRGNFEAPVHSLYLLNWDNLNFFFLMM